MAFLFVIVIILFLWVFHKNKELRDQISRLSQAVQQLQHEFNILRDKGGTWEKRASAEAEEKAPEPEPEKPPVVPVQPSIQAKPIQPEPIQADAEEALPPIEAPTPSSLPLEKIVEAVQSEESPEARPEPPQPPPSGLSQWWRSFKANVDWEQFTGVKLFAWLGGLALFIAAGFFVKYSIDRNLIPPALRLAISALAGIALIIASGRFDPDRFRVMRHTLAAGGIGVLYAVVFAATLYYEFISKPLGFGMLALISAAAFVLAVRYRGLAISVMGALGAYAAPVLVSTGQGNLLLLTGYLAIVNIGVYEVAKRLSALMLLLMAGAGTLLVLFLGTHELWAASPAIIIGLAWIINLTFFSFIFWAHPTASAQEKSFLWSVRLVYSATLLMSVFLMNKPGEMPLVMVVAAQVGAFCLAWRKEFLYAEFMRFSVPGFLAVLAWVLLRFDMSRFSAGFVLMLLYGGLIGVGPLALMRRYGINRAVIGWMKVFPVIIVLVSIGAMLIHPGVSFWFWPLLLGLLLLGIGISLLFHALIQGALLVLLGLIAGLGWLFHLPAETVGIGFFISIMTIGVILCAAILWLSINLRKWQVIFGVIPEAQAEASITESSSRTGPEKWLAAAPAGAVCMLLAVSFFLPYPHYPHPGMATLVCFLALVLLAIHRMRFEIPGVSALIGCAAAQAISVWWPAVGPDVAFSSFCWAAVLFLAALPTPFIFFRSSSEWRRLWHAWALFEVSETVFVLYTSQALWGDMPAVKWIPLLLVVLKLPGVMRLLSTLEGRPERNAILAFHGGAVLFYFSALPVLVLNHGWIGLSFVIESAALLWLNRRIEHPGLRWVSLALAPVGLFILVLHLPVLKAFESPPIMNAAVLSVAVGLAALVAAMRWTSYPESKLGGLNLPVYFQWLTVATGFFLVNLIISDVFAPAGKRFQVWPGHDFLQTALYALSWTLVGALTWRLSKFSRAVRRAGLVMVGIGSIWLIYLPVALSKAIAGMPPLLNIGLAVYLPLLAVLYYLFHQTPWENHQRLTKNFFLTLFLSAGFITLKLQASTLFQAGYPFTLFSSHTPTQAAVSAAGWMAYGMGLLIWPRRLDHPFRLAGAGLILIGIIKALALPFGFRIAFAAMAPLLNLPTLIFALSLVLLVYLTLRPWDSRWPLPDLNPKVFWGILLALATFCVLNIEIAAAFAIKGRAFSMLAHGSLAMQLAYSIGWLLYAIGLLVVGIKWDAVKVRWAAIIAIVVTVFKVFIRDLWSLGQLYRVGSFLGLAVVLILVSFLYQRFLSEGKKNEN